MDTINQRLNRPSLHFFVNGREITRISNCLPISQREYDFQISIEDANDRDLEYPPHVYINQHIMGTGGSECCPLVVRESKNCWRFIGNFRLTFSTTGRDPIDIFVYHPSISFKHFELDLIEEKKGFYYIMESGANANKEFYIMDALSFRFEENWIKGYVLGSRYRSIRVKCYKKEKAKLDHASKVESPFPPTLSVLTGNDDPQIWKKFSNAIYPRQQLLHFPMKYEGGGSYRALGFDIRKLDPFVYQLGIKIGDTPTFFGDDSLVILSKDQDAELKKAIKELKEKYR